MTEQLASHEKNLDYYRKFPTDELKRLLPRAKADVENTTRRLAAI